jgi:hypothetical protein
MLSRLLTGVCAVAGSLTGAQFPAFYTQYLQYVSGRLSQVMRDLQPVLQEAQARGLSVETYLARAAQESNAYTEASVKGDVQAYVDLRQLENAYTALSDTTALMQPVVFAQHLRFEDASRVVDSYTPALPLSPEGIAYGASGLLIGIVVAWLLETPARLWQDARVRRRLRRREAPHQTSAKSGGRREPRALDTGNAGTGAAPTVGGSAGVSKDRLETA